MRTRNKIAIAVGATAGIVGLGLLAGAGGNGFGGRPRVPGTKQPDGGTTWGDRRPQGDFDPLGNELWISEDCESIYEGARFWPDPPEVDRRVEGKVFNPEVALGRVCRIVDTRALPSQPYGCTALDVVDSLIIDQGITDPKAIADEIMRQQAPLCFDAPVSTWPDALYSYYNDLLDRLVGYVDDKRAFLGT